MRAAATGSTPEEIAATFPPLTDAQCLKVASLLSLAMTAAPKPSGGAS